MQDTQELFGVFEKAQPIKSLDLNGFEVLCGGAPEQLKIQSTLERHHQSHAYLKTSLSE